METGIEKVSSTLSVLPTSKQQVDNMVAKATELIENGEWNPLTAQVIRKGTEDFWKKLKPVLDKYSRDEAEKHGAKEFEFGGGKIALAENGIEWDYSNCNDPVLVDLQIEADNANQRLKDRQKFLQGLKLPTKIENEMSDSHIINPPVRSSTSGLRVSLT